ncbi:MULTISPECIES: integrase arm-type DNA-binding domain-containing protein [unclassified Halomonas]|uniref:tyrosine-type recombinase/integrase n=1 Tax=unclassified Halomonas TaxID=2609666 RepID=UPI002076A972|nr:MULTISPECIES: integrase arm-type DNA-binding domain-containing protein [unclassified Halomonas]
MPISDTKARKASPAEKPYRIPDADGLYLDVRPSGKKYWRVRYFLHGKENLYTPGQYPQVTLKEARKQRDDVKHNAAQGIDPKALQRAEREKAKRSAVDTFDVIAREWWEKQSPRWSEYYARQVMKGIEREMAPAFGSRNIREVTPADVLMLVQKIEARGAPTVAMLVRQWIGQIYRYAASTLRADHDPAAPIEGAIQRPQVQHSKSLKSEELAELASSIDSKAGWRINCLAMQVLMRTMLRTGELRQGRWEEVDFMRAEWRIPAARMKMRRPHVVPLSTQTVAYLQELHGYTGHLPLMFPSYRHPGMPISGTTINKALERMGWQGRFSGHGFRSTASTLLNEHGWRGDLIEKQLAHVPGDKVRAAYNHADYLKERREMLQWYSDYIDAIMQGAAAPPVPARMLA